MRSLNKSGLYVVFINYPSLFNLEGGIEVSIS